MFKVDQFDVVPLFSSPLGITKIEEDMSALDKIKWHKHTITNDSGSQISESSRLLNEFPKEKDIILKYFNEYKDKLFCFNNTKFKLYSSWSTKCERGQSSDLHNHTNSMFSGVYYLDDIEENVGGDLQFSNIGINQSGHNVVATQLNSFNSDSFTIKPAKNVIVFFPSYIFHKITPYKGLKDRYSIAMNFMPTGKIGYGDSNLEIEII